jgi:tetratricopeptide (TPR) repeat protein
VKLEAGRSYTIDLKSPDRSLDALLIVRDAANKVLASDNDRGGNRDARVVFRPPATATYSITATSFPAGATGNFTLRVAESSPPAPGRALALANQWRRLGRLRAGAGLTADALACFRGAEQVFRQVLRDNPRYKSVLALRRGLAAAREEAGDVLAATGRLPAALASYRLALPTRQRLADANPAVTEYQADLARTHFKLGVAQARSGQADAALEALDRALEIQGGLVRQEPGVKDYARLLARQHFWQGKAQRTKGNRGEALAAYREARAVLEKVPPEEAGDFLDLATVRAAEGTLAAGPADQEKQAGLAVAALRQAVARGYKDLKRLTADEDLAPLRPRRDFKDLLADLEKKRKVLRWLDDVDEARARARKEGKDLLLWFGGSDWATMEVLFRKTRLTREAFFDYANKHFVPVYLDAPRYGPPPRNRQAVLDLRARWRVTGVPDLILADARGQPYARHTGVKQDNSLAEFIAFLEDLRQVRVRRDKYLARAASARGREKLRWLDRALHAVPPFFVKDQDETIRQILRADPGDRLGYRTRYQELAVGVRLREIQPLVRARDWAGVVREASALLKELGPAGPAASGVLSARAAAHAARGEYDLAAADFARAGGQAPKAAVTRYLHGLAVVAAGRDDEYRLLCAKMLDDFKDDPAAVLPTLQMCSLLPGAVADRERLVRLAAKATPDYNGARLGGRILYRAGRYGEAAKRLQESFRMARKNPQFFPLDYAVVALAYHRQGQAKQAASWLARARRQQEQRARDLARDPVAALAWGFWGNPVAEGLFFAEAQALIEGSPPAAAPKLRLALARAHARLGQWDKALADYDLLLKEQADDPAPWLERGRVKEHLGQREPAGEDFARARELQAKEAERRRAALDKAPDDPAARAALQAALYGLVRIEIQRGRPEEAAAALLERQKLRPGQPGRLYVLAQEVAKLMPPAAGSPQPADAAAGARRRRLADQAVAALRAAVDAGFDDPGPLRTGKVWAPLRERDDFRKLLAKVETRARFPLPTPELRRLAGHDRKQPVLGVAVWPDGRRALSASFDGSIRLWDLARGAELRWYDRFPGKGLGVALSPDGRRALIATNDHVAQLWDVETGRALRDLRGPAQGVTKACFLPDGRRALCGGSDGVLRLWDLEIGKEVRTFLGHRGSIQDLAVSPDGRRALSGGNDGLLRLWDLETGRLVRKLAGHRAIGAVAFSPDGRRALSGGYDGLAILWDLQAGKEIRRCQAADKVARDVLFAPDGRWALVVGPGRFERWDLETGHELDLAGEAGSHLRVALLPGGRRALTADVNGVLRLWDLSEESARAALFLRAGKRDRARLAYTDLLERRPDEGWAALFRGRLYARADQWEKAAADFTRAAKSPDLAGAPEAWVDAARCHALLGRWDESAAAFARALDLSAEADRAPLVGEVAGWGPALDRLGKLRPNDPAVGRAVLEAARARLRLFAQRGEWDKAAALVEAERARRPGDAGPLLLAAALHVGKAEHLRRQAGARPAPGAEAHEQQARVLYEKVLALQPTNPAVASELAGLLLRGGRKWHVLHPVRGTSAGGATLTPMPDGSVLASGAVAFPEAYTVTAKTSVTGITAVRVEVLADKGLPAGGPGRNHNGNFVLSEFRVEARLPGEPGPKALKLRRAVADFAQDGYPVQHAIDGNLGTGWAVLPEVGRDHAAFFELQDRLDATAGTALTFTLSQNYAAKGHNLGKFRLSVTTGPWPGPLERLALAERNGLSRLGLAYLSRGRWRAALGPLREAAASPTATTANLLLALANARLGKMEVARAALDRVLDRLGREKNEGACALAEEILSLAREPVPGDPELLACRARVREWLGRQGGAAADRARLLAVLDRRLAAGPRRPRDLWLRAEVYAARGQWDRAAADLKEYFARTKGAGPRWFQTGWWVVGPYPEDLKTACAPETQTDPFRPVAAADKAGLLSWRAAGSGEYLDLWSLFNHAEHISDYSQVRVYSPVRRHVALVLGSDDAVRVWLNGKLVHENPAYRFLVADADTAPATLQPGWNVLLVKVTNGISVHGLFLRLSDEPGDVYRAVCEGGHGGDGESTIKEYLARYPGRVPVLYAAASYYRRRAEELHQAKPGGTAARAAVKRARALYEKLITLRPESPYYPADLAGLLRTADPEAALHFLDGEVKRRPGDVLPLAARGELLAERKRWKQAAADFGRARALAPERADYWYAEAVAHLGGRDLADYRRTCEAMLKHFRNTDQSWPAERVGYACVPVAGAVKDRDGLVALARLAAKLGGQRRLLGAALYRAGDAKEAVRQMGEGVGGRAWDFFFLALAHHRLGDVTRARAYYDRGCRWVEAAGPKDWVGWYERVDTECLRREAAALFQGKTERAAAR